MHFVSCALLQEVVKDPFSIHGSWCSFWMELDCHKWFGCMFDALVSAIVGIDEPGLKANRDFADCETVVLGSNIAALRVLHEAWLVLATMPKFHLTRITSCCQCQ